MFNINISFYNFFVIVVVVVVLVVFLILITVQGVFKNFFAYYLWIAEFNKKGT